VSVDAVGCFLNPDFKVWITLSASPVDAEWYGAVLTCRMLLDFMNLSKSCLLKADPLSQTSTSGIPCVANEARRLLMVVVVFAGFTRCKSTHFVLASIIIQNIDPRNGIAVESNVYLAKPTCAAAPSVIDGIPSSDPPMLLYLCPNQDAKRSSCPASSFWTLRAAHNVIRPVWPDEADLGL